MHNHVIAYEWSESPRYTVKNGISNLYILLKSALKMQEMPFQRPKFQNIFGGGGTPPLRRHYGLPLTKILATPLGAPLPYDGATYIAYTQNNGQFNALNKCFIHINHEFTLIVH